MRFCEGEEKKGNCQTNLGVLQGLEWTFDTVASTYEKIHPGYVKELYQSIWAYKPINAASRVVEVGIGAGQATWPFLQTGCSLTAVERGENFSALCREKFKAFPGFSVITGQFENVVMEDNAYDMVYSVSAFHWVPEEMGYAKVFALLKPGGAFVCFANHPFRDKGTPLLSEEMDRLYQAYYDKFYGLERGAPQECTERQASQRAQLAAKYGFEDVRYALFHRTRMFTAKEYIALLGTYSDHIAMEESLRTEFFSKIEDAINKHGGTITLYDTMDLQLARKP